MDLQTDYDPVLVVVKQYLEGLYQRKIEVLEQAIWAENQNIGISAEDTFWLKDFEFWRQKCQTQPPMDMNNVEFMVESIDIWHRAAVARVKMTIRHPDRTYECMDFLSMLKFDEGWKVVNKMWSARNIARENNN